jgi:hypothetical protein
LGRFVGYGGCVGPYVYAEGHIVNFNVYMLAGFLVIVLPAWVIFK